MENIPLKFVCIDNLLKGDHFIGLDGIHQGMLFVKSCENIAISIRGDESPQTWRSRGSGKIGAVYYIGTGEHGLVVNREVEYVAV